MRASQSTATPVDGNLVQRLLVLSLREERQAVRDHGSSLDRSHEVQVLSQLDLTVLVRVYLVEHDVQLRIRDRVTKRLEGRS